MWCIPKVDEIFIKRMEDVLTLYAKPYNPAEPVICFDEKSKQLLRDIRTRICCQEGISAKRDYEYKCNGTRNIFIAVEPKGGYREATVTKRRTKKDFAHEIKRLTELPRYQQAKTIHLVLDNLNTHFKGSFIETFGIRKANPILKRIKFHYTPKHASWLNMAEIELSILSRQALTGRIPTEEKLVEQMTLWEEKRNLQQATIKWKFTKEDARKIFKYGYGRVQN